MGCTHVKILLVCSMICTQEQINSIILNNPNKDVIEFGKSQSEVLTRNINGKGLKDSFKRNSYFENDDVFNNRTLNPTSNKDLFARLFQREGMVFTAHGGSTYYDGLNPDQTKALNAKLDSIRFGYNLRTWIQQFALQAYRNDPMGVIHIEINANKNIYPTYKCSYTIYDYLTNGRQLEYICYLLSSSDVISFGIMDNEVSDAKEGIAINYYRFCDDFYDTIYKKRTDSKGTTVTIVKTNGKNPIRNQFNKLPVFVVSDLISYNNSQLFISPIDNVIELAETFCGDRSIRDLQKKYCGFLKSVEPLLDCGLCHGTGQLSGSDCPDCAGTGKKLHTTVGDVARFSLDTIKEFGSVDKLFAYINVPVEVWNKQDMSLNDIENMIVSVYWGTDLRSQTTNGPDINAKNIEETATKTLANLQPIYARLNKTADWAQKTENMIIDFIGQFTFKDKFKKSAVTYGRYYVLETPGTLIDEYLDMKQKGCSQIVLDEALKKYYHSMYKDNQIKLAIMIKMMSVEPFIHYGLHDIQATTRDTQTINPAKTDYISKLYFNDWFVLQKEDYLLTAAIDVLKKSLSDFATEKAKIIALEKPVVPPVTPNNFIPDQTKI